MNHHTNLSEEERDTIAFLYARRKSLRTIAREIERSVSTVSDELRRNRYKDGYVAIHAQRLADDRKRAGPAAKHPLKSAWLENHVLKKLRKGWSPEQIAGRLKRKYPKDQSRHLHHETIYEYIYHPDRRDEVLWEYLPRKQKKRRKQIGRSVHRSHIPDRVSVHKRPKVVDDRSEFGHWEDDTVEGKGHKDGMHTSVERRSRLLAARKVAAITSDEAVNAQRAIFAPLPAHARRSTTMDNGKETHHHTLLRSELGMDTYHADPYSSWQRGTNENTNGLLRRYIPKGTSMDTLTDEDLADIVEELNDRPRKCLDYATPFEVFTKLAGVRIPRRM